MAGDGDGAAGNTALTGASAGGGWGKDGGPVTVSTAAVCVSKGAGCGCGADGSLPPQAVSETQTSKTHAH
jgi:hypothetical protein